MTLHVVAEPESTTLYRLEVWDGTHLIGEYERSQHADIGRKAAEVNAAADYLLELFDQHGPFVVRWDGGTREKVVRDQHRNRIGQIPREHWRQPSRQTRGFRGAHA